VPGSADEQNPASAPVELNPEPPSDDNSSSLLPVPEAAALEKARQTVREIFGSDLAAAKTPEKKAELAQRLLKQGSETLDDSAGRYALLDAARRTAELAGNLDVCFQAIDELGQSFELEAIPLKEEALVACSKTAKKSAEWEQLALSSAILVDQAVTTDDYAAAQRLAVMSLELARKARVKEITTQALNRGKEVAAIAEAYDKVRDAAERLKTEPRAAADHQAWGEFLCFVKGDWSAGLPHLANGPDESLRKLALKDLQENPIPSEWVELADGWLAKAQAADGSATDAMRRRAAYWYRLALPELTGLTRSRVEKALNELPKEPDAQRADIAKTATTSPVKSPKRKPPPRAASPWEALAGAWTVRYSNGAIRRYEFDAAGNVLFVDLKQTTALSRLGNDVVLDFGDGKLERIRFADGVLLLEHFDPASRYPESPTLTARATRQ